MKIALDAMGGDNAPAVTVRGALEAVQAFGVEVILVGDEGRIKKELNGQADSRLTICPASEVVAMDESPSQSLRRKKDSSIRVAVDLVKAGKADAVVSAGNTGAMVATSFFVLGTADGVDRPAIATMMPSVGEPFLLLDAGATVDCKPLHLLQFAVMGDVYASMIMGRAKPRIGLLSIGEEASKGNELTKEAFKLLSGTHLNFVGNVEGKEIFQGTVDVVVCDGFIGNVALKIGEGIVESSVKMLRNELRGHLLGKLGFLMLKAGAPGIRKKLDYSEYGGAPLLGINGTCIISHGRSSAKAIRNAIGVAVDAARKGLNETVRQGVRETMTEVAVAP